MYILTDWLEAKDVSERHFKVSYIEDAREMLAAYQDFVDNQLPIINEKAREFGPQLNYFQRMRVSSSSITISLFS